MDIQPQKRIFGLMSRFWRFVVPVFIFGSSMVYAQYNERVDSLLAARNYAGALEAVNAAPGGSVDEARTVVNHLQALPNLSDSLFNARVVNAKILPEEFEAANAGGLSASFYTNMLQLHASQKFSAAYECLVLARYFRTKHVRQELDRLRNNLAMTYGYVASEEFTKADELFGGFSREPHTAAFKILEDSLHRAYGGLRSRIEDGKNRQGFVRSRTSISRNWYVTGGAGLNPSVKLDKEMLRVTEVDPKVYAVWENALISIKTMAILACLEGGYYVSPRTSVGLSFAWWRETYRNPLKNRWNGEYSSYRVAVEYMRADAFVKYRLIGKTGPRPFLTGGLGIAASALTPQDDPEAGHTFQIEERKTTVYRLVFGGGLEYVFSEDSPVLLSLGASAYLNTGQSEILDKITFETTLQVGVIL
jgi:hypothetical protein